MSEEELATQLRDYLEAVRDSVQMALDHPGVTVTQLRSVAAVIARNSTLVVGIVEAIVHDEVRDESR